MFTQTLSDLTLDWSKVRSDKLLCVNTALVIRLYGKTVVVFYSNVRRYYLTAHFIFENLQYVANKT